MFKENPAEVPAEKHTDFRWTCFFTPFFAEIGLVLPCFVHRENLEKRVQFCFGACFLWNKNFCSAENPAEVPAEKHTEQVFRCNRKVAF